MAISLILLMSLSDAESTSCPINAGNIKDAAVDNNRKKRPKENSTL
jgi:hypothetical protein